MTELTFDQRKKIAFLHVLTSYYKNPSPMKSCLELNISKKILIESTETCGVCDKYIGGNMSRFRFLPCNHSFCRSCDIGLANKNGVIDTTEDVPEDLKCPTCNQKVTDYRIHLIAFESKFV